MLLWLKEKQTKKKDLFAPVCTACFHPRHIGCWFKPALFLVHPSQYTVGRFSVHSTDAKTSLVFRAIHQSTNAAQPWVKHQMLHLSYYGLTGNYLFLTFSFTLTKSCFQVAVTSIHSCWGNPDSCIKRLTVLTHTAMLTFIILLISREAILQLKRLGAWDSAGFKEFVLSMIVSSGMRFKWDLKRRFGRQHKTWGVCFVSDDILSDTQSEPPWGIIFIYLKSKTLSTQLEHSLHHWLVL